MYFNSKFSIGCLYFEENPESIPEELIEVVEILNELKEHIDSFHYQSKEIEVSVQLLKPKEQESDLPLHEVLRLSDLGSLCRHPKCLLTDKSFFDSCGGFG